VMGWLGLAGWAVAGVVPPTCSFRPPRAAQLPASLCLQWFRHEAEAMLQAIHQAGRGWPPVRELPVELFRLPCSLFQTASAGKTADGGRKSALGAFPDSSPVSRAAAAHGGGDRDFKRRPIAVAWRPPMVATFATFFLSIYYLKKVEASAS